MTTRSWEHGDSHARPCVQEDRGSGLNIICRPLEMPLFQDTIAPL
jgi:hypothetical protein